MSDIEVISLTIILVSLFAAITIIRVWPRKNAPVETILKTPVPDSLWHTETTTTSYPPAEDKVVFSTTREEAKATEEALEKHRSKKDKPATKGEAEDKVVFPAKNEPEDFDTSLLDSVEEGIASLEKKVIEAAKDGDADFVKKAFRDLDWLEDLRDRLLNTLEAPRR